MHVSTIASSLGRTAVFDNLKDRVGKDVPVLDSRRCLSKGMVNAFLNDQKSIVNDELVSNILEVGMINKDLKSIRNEGAERKGRETY